MENQNVTLRLLKLIRELTNKAAALEGIGIKLMLTDEMIEEVTTAMFEINEVNPAAAGPLHLSLVDYTSGAIEAHDFLSLLSGAAVMSG
ncbi:hypothetical protein [Paenibacillus sp. AR247]|uniref:hypothetical protein n=1 Tax=Paenibacillus sp. AR247 TaxID=1631599 RepID=UPI000CF93814|nr:hypothetical protein [Paenibacillus sp. AR247]PQP89677.1 hypothetical protein CPT76_16915 [Paenibacillus sp. AR247]